MERHLRNNAEGIRKKPWSTSCFSERSERLEFIVMCFLIQFISITNLFKRLR